MIDLGAILGIAAFVWGVLVWRVAQRRLDREDARIEATNGRVGALTQRVNVLEASLEDCEHDRDQYLRERDRYMRLYAQEKAGDGGP